MVKIIQNKNRKLYQCEECGLKYENKKIAEIVPSTTLQYLRQSL